VARQKYRYYSTYANYLMNRALKKLAGETAVYGLSTILARFINFLLVPFYSRVMITSGYGEVSEVMAYIAILQVILVMGLETGCFRFANKADNPNKIFSNALLTVAVSSAVTLILFVILSNNVATMLGYNGYSLSFVYVGGILAIDTFTAIVFAKLRFEHKAMKFAVIKTIKILSETSFNFILFLFAPAYLKSHPGSFLHNFIGTVPNFSYVIFAIFLSCVVLLILLLPDIFKIKFSFNSKIFKQMMSYSLPLMVAGLPGIMNDFIDRPMFRFFTPEGMDWKSQLGVYAAWVKLAVLMTLFVQMFRFASEPFFFNREKESDSRELYAQVMEHFTAFAMFIFLGMMLFVDLVSLILGAGYRGGYSILPIMLMANVLLGISFNVSMWYKLTGKTNIAIWITLSGVTVTLLINMIFMPIFSYQAAAWGHLASYLVMLSISLYFGNKYYPIPYKWGRVISFIIAGLVLYIA
jgi:O-antigen/teichoic acid export membrane protein